MNAVPPLLAAALLLNLGSSFAGAQTLSSESKTSPSTVQTFYLKNAAYSNDLNEIVTTVRNILPASIKIYAVQAQSAIVLEAGEEQLQLARRIIDALDRPRKAYRITYTITEVDGTKRMPAQHISINAVSGQTATVKQGSRVSVITSNAKTDPANPSSQYTYVDVGLSVSATVTAIADGASVMNRIEESSIAPDRSSPAMQNPNIQQTSLVTNSILPNGKSTLLGSLDLPGGGHHLEIEALLEPIR